jgi:hypothetical protein
MTQPSPAGAPKPRPGNLVTAGLLVSLLALLAIALVTTAGAQGPRRNTPLIQDWSHRHVIFPNNPNRPMSLGGPIDPRAWLAWLQRNAPGFQVSGAQAPSPVRPPVSLFPNRPVKKGFKLDWAVSLGSTDAGNGVAQNMYPAKFSFDVISAPSCTDDFVVFPVNLANATRANIVAFNNLYRGSGSTWCGTDLTPTTMWAYRTATGSIYGPVSTSPALSLDGKKVAFVESRGSSSIFHVLTWAAGEGTVEAPATPGTGGSSILSVTYAPINSNERSSPFVDYANDAAYVGANNGVLYKITPVFGVGTPAVVAQITVTSLQHLTGPVRDPLTGIVFVSDDTNVKAYTSSLAYLGMVTPSAANSISDPPVLDVTNRLLYIVTKSNGSNAAVVQIPYTPSPFSFGTAVYGNIGVTGGNALHTGAFDDKYFTSPSGPSAGTLYVCGNQGSGSGNADRPGLYGFAFNGGGVMQTPAVLINDKNLGANTGQCSPMTEFYNLNHAPDVRDKLFVGHTGGHSIQMWNITSRITSTTTSYSAAATATGGTSGIIVDNYSPAAQASSIYFGTLGTAGSCGTGKVCAVKLTQLTLE